MAKMMLKGKVAIVTGAASQLGWAIATKFVDHGASVILADTNNNVQQSSFQSLLSTLNLHKNSTMAHPMDCDVRKPSNILDTVLEARRIYNKDVDIFYNNAGVQNQYRPYSYIEVNSFKETMAVNVESFVASIKHAGDVMRTNNKGGCILCTGSAVGSLGHVMPSWYSISKTAVEGVLRTIAAELRSHHVRVNVISPRDVVANFDKHVLKQIFDQPTNMQLDDMMKRYEENRVSHDDVPNAAVYLASDHGKKFNGQNFVLNGSFTL